MELGCEAGSEQDAAPVLGDACTSSSGGGALGARRGRNDEARGNGGALFLAGAGLLCGRWLALALELEPSVALGAASLGSGGPTDAIIVTMTNTNYSPR